MPEFVVYLHEVWRQPVVVEASDTDEALHLAVYGDGRPGDYAPWCELNTPFYEQKRNQAKYVHEVDDFELDISDVMLRESIDFYVQAGVKDTRGQFHRTVFDDVRDQLSKLKLTESQRQLLVADLTLGRALDLSL
jgi:hypothetical protein